MASFLVYTYQFQRPIPENKQMKIDFISDEMWNKKQDLFSKLFVKEKNIPLTNKYYNFNCTVTYNCDGIIILVVTYQKTVFLNTKKLKVRKAKDYKPVVIIFDNRKDKQRAFIQRTIETKFFRNQLHGSLNKALDKLMDQYFRMSFSLGEVPNYSIDVFWKEFDAAKSKLSNVRFSFPPPNLPRITDMAGHILGLREETKAGVNMELKASKQGWLNIKKVDDSSFASLVKVSGESGATIKVKRYGSKSFMKLGGKSKDGMTIMIDDETIHFIIDHPEKIDFNINGIIRQFDEL